MRYGQFITMSQEEAAEKNLNKRAVSIGDSADRSVIVTGDKNIVNVTYQGTQISIPSPEAIAAHRTALKKQLQADACKRWGGMSIYIQEEGASLPIEASPYQTGRLGVREPLLRALHDADRLLLLGDPGSGKTVSLERLGWALCGSTNAVIPVLIRLFRYDGVPLAEWVRTHLHETGHLWIEDEKALAAFLKAGSATCYFLFDGLNEVQPDYRDKLVGGLARWMRAYPHHPVILTSRPQDELWRRLREEMNRAMVVQPIDFGQARDYLIAHLEDKGAQLYSQLDQRLREMARTPLILWLIKEAGGADESIPGNRGELYARFVSRMLHRDTDRRMDAEIQERVKRRALAELAYHLSLHQRLSCHRDEAVQLLITHFGEELSEAVIGACARHGLLSGEDTIWFAPHQTIQEHFAALTLQKLARCYWGMSVWEKLKLPIQRRLSTQDNSLWGLAAQDSWMETFIQLAGVVEDADRLAQDIVRVNPWLAWWCVQEGRNVTQETGAIVAESSTRMLVSERVANRRRAVSTLAQIRSPRTIEPLFRAVVDQDDEVAGLALQTLLEMGKGAGEKALSLAQNPKNPLYSSGIAYLEMVVRNPEHALHDSAVSCLGPHLEAELGFPFVWISPGPFLMGSDGEKDPHARDAEFPQHEVVLPGYWISRYPVTWAQFRAFAKAAAGYDASGKPALENLANRPVSYLIWNYAMAYCQWLDEKTRLQVTLPSEAEWEKAARGTDGRIYPWGDENPTEEMCNFDHNIGGTTPVGKYSPQGDSPYGCADMSGNVWEWTRSIFTDYPYEPDDGRENLERGHTRVVRGGSFNGTPRFVRCATRYRVDPSNRLRTLGFRVVVSPHL
jgi:formylglycine-generating enzyme required for sulfatase activity